MTEANKDNKGFFFVTFVIFCKKIELDVCPADKVIRQKTDNG